MAQRYTPPPPERRCTATSRQRKAQCLQWTLPGEKKCKYHGGALARAKRGKPNEANMTHGLRSKFLTQNEAGYYVRAMRDIKATDGAEVLADSAAFTLAKVAGMHERNPEAANAPESADILLRAESVIGRQLEARARIMSERTADVQQTLVIQAPNLTQPTYTPVRGPQGRADLVTLPDGKHLLSCEPGVWREAKRTVTEEGAEVWQPVFELGSGQ